MGDDKIEVLADDKTVIEGEGANNQSIENTTLVDIDERILTSKIQTIEEYLQTLMSRQEIMLQTLREIQSKLSLELHNDPVLSEYERALAGYLDRGL